MEPSSEPTMEPSEEPTEDPTSLGETNEVSTLV